MAKSPPPPTTIAGLIQLPEYEQRTIFGALIPSSVLERFHIHPDTYADQEGHDLLEIHPAQQTGAVEITLRQKASASDPLLYMHMADTRNYKVIVLLMVVNDPTSPRFDIDRMPDGTATDLGANKRNLAAEVAAMEYGLAPGQIRRGLRVFGEALALFERFVTQLNDELFYVEPLYYHNAILFEHYGFAYQQGLRWMESINARFTESNHLYARLDGSTPFRRPELAHTVRGRSWAIHDGILGEPFTGVRMYKRVAKNAQIETFPGGKW